MEPLTEALAGLEGRRLVGEALARVLAPVLAYDHDTGSDLLRTLRLYVETGGALQETADALFLHRNSVAYRLQRIQDLAGLDPRDSATRRALLVAFAVTGPASLSPNDSNGGQHEDQRP